MPSINEEPRVLQNSRRCASQGNPLRTPGGVGPLKRTPQLDTQTRDPAKSPFGLAGDSRSPLQRLLLVEPEVAFDQWGLVKGTRGLSIRTHAVITTRASQGAQCYSLSCRSRWTDAVPDNCRTSHSRQTPAHCHAYGLVLEGKR